MRISMPATSVNGIPWSTDKQPLMFSVISQALLPLAIMVSLYIFVRGHNLPGGGFIAGLITSIAIIQQYIAHGTEWMHSRIKINYLTFISSGLLIALTTGVGAMLAGNTFLTSWHDYVYFPIIGKVELATAMLFDLGVYLTVIGAVMLILANLGGLTSPERIREEGGL
jgi:multicomponent K+:H+ antiporter subunit A